MIKDTTPHHREIRSFVLREGHLSKSQIRAIETLLPIWGIEYKEEIIDLKKIFQRDSAKILEIGFGMGDASIQIAQKLPEKDFIALEVHRPGIGNLLKLIEEKQVSNIRIIPHDAKEVIQHMIADQSLDGVHIFFPDPWQKKRHHKRRLIQALFIQQLLPKLSKNAYLHIATDWENYALQILEVLNTFPELTNRYSDYAPIPSYRVETKFELRGKKIGHHIWDIIFDKK